MPNMKLMRSSAAHPPEVRWTLVDMPYLRLQSATHSGLPALIPDEFIQLPQHHYGHA